MTLREQRQIELSDKWLESNFGIILAAPRMGKSSIGIRIFNILTPDSILIVYPDGKIKQSWLDEFERLSYSHSNITFTTYLSLHKYQEEKYDIVVLDECHLMSEQQLLAAYELLKLNKVCLGLTGTLAKDTEKTIRNVLGLRVIAEYSIEQAIKEGVIANYEIEVVTVPLDNKIAQKFGKKIMTEKSRFNRLSYIIDEMTKKGRLDTKFLRLTRMRVIQNSLAKLNKTKSLLQEHKEERVLVFTGTIRIADSLGIPSYHSKSSEKNIFEDFVKGDVKQLAVCKIGNSGITYTPLNRVIINFTDSDPEMLTQKINRCLSMEYDNPEKKGLITIISTNEGIELQWIKKGLSFFSQEKIKYL